MSEEKPGFLYSRESHPHTGDPRVDPQARSKTENFQNAGRRKLSAKDKNADNMKLFSKKDFGEQELAEVQNEKDQAVLEEKTGEAKTHPRVRIEMVEIKGQKKQKIIINEGTRDEIVHIGRIYGLRPKTVIRSSPAETRDSQIIYISKAKDAFFKVDGMDISENGVPYFWGITVRNNGIGKLPTLITPGVVRKWDIRKTNIKQD